MNHNDPKEKGEYLAGYDVAIAIAVSEILHAIGEPKRSNILLKLAMVPAFEQNEYMRDGFTAAKNQISQPPLK